MYKIVAVDLDGTLLNSFGEVSLATKETLNKVKERGVEVVLASGRTIDSVENLSLELNTSRYIISGNGAILYDVQEKEILHNRFLSKKQVLDIIKICDENSIFYNVYAENEIITPNLSYNVLFYHKENVNKEESKRTVINVVENVSKYIEESDKNEYLKVTICDETKFIFNSIIRKLRTYGDIDVLDVSHMSRKKIKVGTTDVDVEYFYTEITNKNVNKWTALEVLLKRLNIVREEVMAIGDNINDKEMIEEAGLGIVTGNSSPMMKEIADVVVADNNSDGVKEALEKYILGE